MSDLLKEYGTSFSGTMNTQMQNKKINIIRLFSFSLLVLYSCNLIAQTTLVSGKVLDAHTNAPLPFVNIILKGTKAGTTSDADGNYALSTLESPDSLVVSYIGYLRTSASVKAKMSQVINLYLKANTFDLQTIEVKPGENPAHIILRKIIENKDKNDPAKLDAFQYEVYNKIEFDLNNLSEDFKKKRVFKPFEFMFNNIDSSNITEKPYLPMFLSESLSDYYYKRSPSHKKEIIRASKVSGIENNSVSQFMGDMYQKVNIYDNAILVFDKNFISPISDHGLFFYKYYLIDSLFLGDSWCYQIQFKPRRKQELTFNGNFWVADTSFAIKRLEMGIAGDANINFINNLNVIQEYKHIGDAWMLSKDKLVVDFSLQDKKMGLYGRKSTTYGNFVINAPREDKFYSPLENLVIEPGAIKKSEEYWNQMRPDTLSKNEKHIYKMIDTLQTMHVYKSYYDIISIFISGYKTLGLFELGPYYNTLSFNTIEGTRLRFGGRTSDAFSKWYELNGYLAYGIKDENLKYSVGIRSFISKNPRQIVGVNIKNDGEVLGQGQNAFTRDNILASVFRRVPLSNLTGVQQISAYYQRDWFPGLQSRITLLNRTLTPWGDFRYEYQNNDNSVGVKNNIVTSEIKLFTRFAYDEKYVSGTFDRASLGTKYPVLQFQYTLGLKGVFNSDYNYHKFSVNVSDRIRINPLGYTDYYLEYGKTLGLLPYPLMEIHGGNETYTYDPFAFNMMNYNEFVSDEYGTMSLVHHFDGLFLNKIPLFRKLKWREVLTAKALVGRVNNNNKNILSFPQTLKALNGGPYYETGFGVENILKIFRFDALWRLSYLDHTNIPKFGVRVSMQVAF